MNWGFWLRWSWRDLRSRWLQVVAVALIIASGTSIYAGLGGMKTWRFSSYDKSYSSLNMYDLRLELADGSFMETAELEALVNQVEGIEATTYRLISPTLVDASQDGETILVRGRIVGVSVDDSAPKATWVNSLGLAEDKNLEVGRNLAEADNGQNVAVLEYKFARFHDIEAGDHLILSGDHQIEIVGLAHSPEYFQVVSGEIAFEFGNEGNFAVIFLPLETAQQLTDHAGLVNNAAFLVKDGVDPVAVEAELEALFQAQHSEVGVNFTLGEDDSIRTVLYSDAEGDQEMWNIFATLFLIGATFGTFNLAGRMVESQRRQIGIGMALGVPRHLIALRPMLVGVQIAILGTLFGLILGWFIGRAFFSVMESFLPLPVLEYQFYFRGYIQATLLGITLPLIATLIPVWRAVRVQPIDAIKSGHLVAKGGGLAGLLKGIPLFGSSFTQLPLKNTLRAPWRTLLTMIGVGLAITMMVMFSGFLDLFHATLGQAEESYIYQGDGRVLITLNFFYPIDQVATRLSELTDESGEALFSAQNNNLLLGGTLHSETNELEILLELLPFDDSAIWKPNLLEGQLSDNGIIISEKAAEDLGVSVGDTIHLEHPKREGVFSYSVVESEVEIIAIHDHPIRAFSYMSIHEAEMMGLNGLSNYVVAMPSEGIKVNDIKGVLFDESNVVSVQGIGEVTDAFDRVLELFISFLTIVQVVVVIMAFLIAFNSTSINVDERVREIATMFAFGLPVRVVTRMQMVENFIIGFFGTLIGIGLGALLIRILIDSRINEQIPDIKLLIEISPRTFVVSMLLGVLTVTLTPLLSVRRMFKMDIPSTLRVME